MTGTATIIDSFVRGTNGDDGMNDTAFADQLDGRGGNDVLGGFAGDDFLPGGAGSDTLIGAAGGDTMAGSADNDSYLTDATDRMVEFADAGSRRSTPAAA